MPLMHRRTMRKRSYWGQILLLSILAGSRVARVRAYIIVPSQRHQHPVKLGTSVHHPTGQASYHLRSQATPFGSSFRSRRSLSSSSSSRGLRFGYESRGSSARPLYASPDARLVLGTQSFPAARQRRRRRQQQQQQQGRREASDPLYRARSPSPLFAVASPSSSLDEPHSSSDGEPASSVQDPSAKPARKYHWTRPTLALAVPALIGMLADPVLSLVDTAYVGRVGSMELAALGSCTSIFHLAFNAFRATTSATTSLVANALGASSSAESAAADDEDGVAVASSPTQSEVNDARQVSWFSLQFGLYMGLAVWFGLVAGGPYALRCMGVPADSPLFKPASEYLYARSWAAPVVLLITVSEGIFRGYGNTIVPLLASLTAAVMNLVLDPILMFRPIHWGVAGAAAATAISQCGAALVYVRQLVKRGMLPSNIGPFRRRETALAATTPKTATASSSSAMNASVIRTILGANLSMMIKQGSLLLGWAFATGRATRLGPQHVAAHQVALSVWLFFALVLDGAAVASQVLMSRAVSSKDRDQAKSLIRYMTKWALIQGVLSMIVLDGLDQAVPNIFTPDKSIQALLHTIMPHLAAQQVLVSLTLVIESLAAGANQFGVLAVGTAISTVAAVYQIGLQTSVDGIWSVGITTLFAGRLVTAIAACYRSIRRRR
jgi:putative MATE family efflux protein